MTRLIPVVVFALSIGACAGSRKGADAGGGPTTTSGTNGGLGLPSNTSGAPAAPAPTVTATPAADTAGLASGSQIKQGQSCDDGKCPPGLECLSYYGFAGSAGPKFTSCEIRCDAMGKPGCPKGQNCVTISDGPGSVCRPPDM